ncbi:ABC transporter substrate-binding protein [Endobacterium cereale]|nr:ABC transporter substrate-binding protein [Endobacterium cereale]MEB2847189.1 ABC transporter substrate-binding protein [Endobacterium cereale]
MTSILLNRRAFLGALALSASTLPAFAKARPERIVCLEWTAAEMVCGLGLYPVAVADLGGYRDWAVEPRLPDTTIDLGSRSEPNMEVIRALAPDLIVTAQGYGVDEQQMHRLAPVVTLPLYDGSSSPLNVLPAETRRLAAIMGRQNEAEALIQNASHDFDTIAKSMQGRDVPPVAVISLFDDRHVRLYGKGGLFQDVMDRVGVTNAWTGETSDWGFSTASIADLVRLEDALILSLDPVPENVSIRVRQSTLWKNLPAVRNNMIISIPPVWPYGGIGAARRFAHFMAAALNAR